MTNRMNIFSVYAGIYYTISSEEFDLLDDGQVPLLKSPLTCKKCYSRGYTGFDSNKHVYVCCQCVNKIADKARIASKFNINSPSV